MPVAALFSTDITKKSLGECMGLLFVRPRSVYTPKLQQTFLTKVYSGTSNGPTTTLYTVPTNTKAKLWKAAITGIGPGAGATGNCNLQISGINLFYLYLSETYVNADGFSVVPEEGIDLLPGQVVTVDYNGGGAGAATASIIVKEEIWR